MELTLIKATKVAGFLAILLTLCTGFLLFGYSEKAYATEGLTAQVFSVQGQNNAPYIPQGASPILTTTVPNINLQWGGGSVLGGPADDVIIRFTGSILSNTTQNISFLATADDGTKLYLDEILITDDWRDKGGGGTTSAPVSFTAGVPKTIELMYYENGGGANVFLYWNQSGSMQIIPAEAFISQAPLTIGAPRNLTVVDGETLTVLSWEAPNTGNTQPERYAISFSADNGGWGIATGNVGEPNSLNTTITINHSVLTNLKPSGTVWSFHIRSDNDTLQMYSANSNVVTLKIGLTEEEIAAAQALLDQQAEEARLAEVARLAEIARLAEVAEIARLAEVARLAEIARLQEEEIARIIAQQAAQAQAEAEAAIAAYNAQVVAQNAAIAEANAAAAEAQARAQAEANAQAVAAAVAQALLDAQAEADALAQVEADAKAEAEARAQAEADAKAEAEAQAQAQAQALLDAQAEADAQSQAKADAQAEADALAQAALDAQAEAEAQAQAEADAIAEAEAQAQDEANAKAEADAIDSGTPKAVDDTVSDALSDGKLDVSEVSDIADVMAADGKIDPKETDQLIDALSKDGKLSTADQEAVLDALASDGEVSKEDLAAIVGLVGADGKLSEAEKGIVADALVQSVAPGENLTKEQVAEAGIQLQDLPPETPVEVRTDNSGNEIVITAEVAVSLELLTDPGALLEAAFSDPGAALKAFGNVGADMSSEERDESTDAIVATVIAAGAAINAVGAATAGAASSTGGSAPSSPGGSGGTGGGPASGGGSGSSSGSRRKVV